MTDGKDPELEEEQLYRASAYALLAALLRAPPQRELLDHVSRLSPDSDAEQDELLSSMAGLAAAAAGRDTETLEDEYNALFIGIGKGEMVPYAPWYLTGFLMEQPLSDLRDDLKRLGFERSGENREPEDHVSAIFEVFSGMIADSSSLSEQQLFFETHMRPWLERFFTDLGKAGSANFYKYVAQFGVAFIKLETAYLAMRV